LFAKSAGWLLSDFFNVNGRVSEHVSIVRPITCRIRYVHFLLNLRFTLSAEDSFKFI
jgi:hypothetical protein